uniref:Uncharacterized protein n=1 Tax=Taeniopygia guttata TaxID=59729 RepID=H0YX09_TAEGU
MEHTGTLLSNCTGGMLLLRGDLPGSQHAAGCPVASPSAHTRTHHCCPAGGCCRTQVLVEMLRATLGCPKLWGLWSKTLPWPPAPSDGAGAEPQHGRASCGLLVPLLVGVTGRGRLGPRPSAELTALSRHHPPHPGARSSLSPDCFPRRNPDRFSLSPDRFPSAPTVPPSAPAVSPRPQQLAAAPRTQSRRGPAGEEPRPEHPGVGGSGLPRARRSAATPARSPLTSPSAAGGTSAVLSVCQAAESSIRAAGRGGAAAAATMSGTGAALRGHHAALREGLSELRARRDELSGRIRAEEAERGRLQARIATLTRRLSDTSENLAGLRSTRAHIDRTIAEMDIASGEILDNSQTLLDVMKKEMGDLGKAIDPQNTSLGQQIRRQKRS